MGQRILSIKVSEDLSPTTSDHLKTDCLRIETVEKIQLNPNSETRINLTVHNTSTVGRMGQIISNFDPREITVKVPCSQVYVAPEGKTVVYAIVSPLINNGQSKVIFDVF